MSDDDVLDSIRNANVVCLPTRPYDENRILRLNRDHAFVLIGSRAAIIRENGPEVPASDRIQFLTISAFRDWGKNQRCRIGDRWRNYSDLWLESEQRRDFRGVRFMPEPGPKTVPEGYFNLWRGFDVSPNKDGNCQLYLEHIERNVCGGNPDLFNAVFGWFASIIQRPQERFGISLVLRGVPGAGKSKIGEPFKQILGPHFLLVDAPGQVVGRFNAHLAPCLLLEADEAFWAGDKEAEGRLKSLITSEVQQVEPKNVDMFRVDNFVRLMITSNEDWVVPVALNDRRFLVVDVKPDQARDHKYFALMDRQLYEEDGLGALLWELQNFDLSKVNLRNPPKTAALWHQKERSMDGVASWLTQRLVDGETRPGKHWEEWVATQRLFNCYRAHCSEMNRRALDMRGFGRRLNELLPCIRKTRGRRDSGDQDLAPRPWGYAFPSLDDCRAQFERSAEQKLDWENGGEAVFDAPST